MGFNKRSRKKLIAFLLKRLNLDDRLELLFHLEECRRCRDVVYYGVKAQHAHYYQSGRAARKTTGRDPLLERLPEDLVA